jgi:hypothetical protein
LITTVPIKNILGESKQVSEHYRKFIIGCLQPEVNQRGNADYIFSYSWPMAQDFIEGFEEEVKMKEVIKVPGKNYAVFHSAN